MELSESQRRWLLVAVEALLGFLLQRIAGAIFSGGIVEQLAILAVWIGIIVLVVLTLSGNAHIGLLNFFQAKAHISEPRFDPHNEILEKVMHVNFTGLWLEDLAPYIEIELYMKQTSGYLVTLTGVQGGLICAGAECQLPPRLIDAPIEMRPHADGFRSVTIRQPLTSEMHQAFVSQITKLNIFSETDLVRFSLTGMQWTGTINLRQGAVALPSRVVSNEPFIVRGPVRQTDTDKMLWPLERIFVSQEHHNLDGSPRERVDVG